MGSLCIMPAVSDNAAQTISGDNRNSVSIPKETTAEPNFLGSVRIAFNKAGIARPSDAEFRRRVPCERTNGPNPRSRVFSNILRAFSSRDTSKQSKY